MSAEACPNDGQSVEWHLKVGGTHPDDTPRTNGEFIGCDFGQPLCPASPPAVAASTGTSEDVEALAKAVFAHEQVARHESVDHRWATTLNDDDQDEYREIARAVLASDWLAAREAAARAEALREAADQLDRDGMKRLGAYTVKQWLRARAAREGR